MIIRLKDIGQRLGCTESMASWLLRHGILKGIRTPHGWNVDEKNIQEYLEHKNDPKPSKLRKHFVHVGDKFGFWTVIDINVPMKNFPSGHRKRQALCRCICGKERLVLVSMLTSGRSKSCGCRRYEHPTKAQKDGHAAGQAVMKKLHAAGLGSRYISATVNKNSSTGYTGVSKMKNGRFRAYISPDRKQIHLGTFETLSEAVAARKTAEEKYFRSRQDRVDKIKRQRHAKKIVK